MNDTWWVNQGQLDDHQKKVFTLPLKGDYLVKGPPGSGKTNVLLLRAKQMIGSGLPNVALVVHTRTLQEFVKAGAPKYGIPASKIYTFRKLAMDLLYRAGASVTLPDDFETSRGIIVQALDAQLKAGRLGREFSCVFIDEAQDLLPGEIDALRRLSERVFAVADSRQKIYVGADSIKKLEAELETITLPFHYRNGHRICTVADGLGKDPGAKPTLLETSKYPEAKMESSVEALQFGSLSAQCGELISRLDSQAKAYPNELIGVACPRREDFAEVVEHLRASPFAEQLVVQSSDDGYEPFGPDKSICVSKLHSAKGLEFRAFHILAAEGLKKFRMQRELAFMGVTRAKTSLCIYHREDLPAYLEEALAKLKGPAPMLGIDQLFGSDDERDE